MRQNKPLNIGLQIASLSDAYNNALIDSINTAAIKLNVNLILFLGGHPDKPNFKHVHHQSVIYDHINSDNLDAIIILSATLSNFISDEEFKSILIKLTSIPIISIGIDISSFIENQSSILINSESGLNNLIESLISQQNYSNLAFITGPLENPEALMRFATYKQVLIKHNIKINPNNIYYGSFDSSDAIPAIDQFLENNPTLEAIICSNDLCALAVIEELSKRNIRVPQQIAVTGFDNVRGTQDSNPPLSTVSQPFIKIGALAVQLAIWRALKKPCNKLHILETDFIKRQSCGNQLPNTFQLTSELEQRILWPIKNKLEEAKTNNFNSSIYSLINDIIELILTQNKNNINNSIVVFEESILNILKKRINYDVRVESGYTDWITSIEKIESKYQESNNKFPEINNSKNQSILLILLRLRDATIKEHALVSDSDSSSRDSIYFIKEVIEEISDSTSFNDLSNKLRARHQQLFDFINLDNYVVLGYPTPIKHYKDKEWISPKTIDVMLSFNDINNEKIQNTKHLDAKYLIPKELAPKKKRYTLVVETLYSGDDQLGRVIYELYSRENILFSCAMITTQIASTIRFIHQINERELSRKKIESLVSDLETKNKVAEEAVLSKGRFLATMSHEIRTPMNGVLGLSELLKDTELNDQQTEYLDIIQTSSHSLLNIISDILDFSKIEEGKLSLENIDFNVNKICEEVISLFRFNAKQNNIILKIEIDEKIPKHIKSDPTRLRQVLINLMGNAFKFTQKGSITLKVSPYKHNHLMTHTDELPIEFSIIDTGIGITKENTEKLFGAFNQADSSTTRKFGGTGLGLSISKSLVELMGGEIGIKSKRNQGSTFWFTIISRTSDQAIIQSTLDSQKNHTDIKHNQITGKEILIAEDNKVNQIVIKAMVKKLGANVTIVNNGEEAVIEYKTSKTKFDLIIMDFEMPVLDGAGATMQIREYEQSLASNQIKPSHIPIIAITAHAMDEHRNLCIQSGMDDHLTKPIDLETLQKMFVQFL